MIPSASQISVNLHLPSDDALTLPLLLTLIKSYAPKPTNLDDLTAHLATLSRLASFDLDHETRLLATLKTPKSESNIRELARRALKVMSKAAKSAIEALDDDGGSESDSSEDGLFSEQVSSLRRPSAPHVLNSLEAARGKELDFIVLSTPLKVYSRVLALAWSTWSSDLTSMSRSKVVDELARFKETRLVVNSQVAAALTSAEDGRDLEEAMFWSAGCGTLVCSPLVPAEKEWRDAAMSSLAKNDFKAANKLVEAAEEGQKARRKLILKIFEGVDVQRKREFIDAVVDYGGDRRLGQGDDVQERQRGYEPPPGVRCYSLSFLASSHELCLEWMDEDPSWQERAEKIDRLMRVERRRVERVEAMMTEQEGRTRGPARMEHRAAATVRWWRNLSTFHRPRTAELGIKLAASIAQRLRIQGGEVLKDDTAAIKTAMRGVTFARGGNWKELEGAVNGVVEDLCDVLDSGRVKSGACMADLVDAFNSIWSSGRGEASRKIEGVDLEGAEYDDGEPLEMEGTGLLDAVARRSPKNAARGNTNSLYYGVGRGLAGAITDSSTAVMTKFAATALRTYAAVQSVEDQDVDNDAFEKFATRESLGRMLLGVVHHPVNKAGRDELRKPEHLRSFLPALSGNMLTAWHFFRDNGLEGALASLRESGGDVKDPKLLGSLKVLRGNLRTVKQAALLMAHVLGDEEVGKFLVDGGPLGFRGAVEKTKAKVVRASLVVLERLECKISVTATGHEPRVWELLRLGGSYNYLKTLVTQLLQRTVGRSKELLKLGARSCVEDLDLTFDTNTDLDISEAFQGCKAFEDMEAEALRIAEADRSRAANVEAVWARARAKFEGKDIKKCGKEAEESLDATYSTTNPGGVEMVDELPGFLFAKKASRVGARTGGNSKIIYRQWAKLTNFLPRSGPGNLITVNVLEGDISCARLLLTCAGSTPYAYGAFCFDIWLPEAFPEVPPMIEILTTGGGTIMLSPNLYADGKVCMAMLNNTPSGFKDERWVPGTSSLGQVLLGIQAQLMVDQPGTMKGLREGSPENEAYMREIRVHTLRLAVAGALKEPTAGLEKAVRKHFEAARDLCVCKVLEWSGEDSGRKMKRWAGEALVELEKL